MAKVRARPYLKVMPGLRHAIQSEIHRLVGFGSGTVDLDHGDHGLFGPRSVAWRVHGDFTSMMIGGVSALLLQMLHPAALAGVWDHSGFRHDMGGRLRRTAQFIAGTTYASTSEAERLIARVRSIHDRVAGVLPDGTAYSANDPLLLAWVHVAEVSSFLAAHRRFREPGMSGAEQDRYFAETACIAAGLGATDVPTSRRDVARFCDAIRPALRSDERTREVVRLILAEPAPTAAARPLRAITMSSAIDLLPGWAADLHGLRRGPAERSLSRAGALGAASILRWALTDGSASRARRRAGEPA